MSLGHGSGIIRDGLAIHYDAANVKSYPGSGNTVYDLSGNGRTGVFGSGTSVSGGAFSFDGVDDYMRTTDVQSISTSTVSAMVWAKVEAHGNFHNFVNNNWVNSGWVIYASATNWIGGVAENNAQYDPGGAHNNSTDWTNLCFTYDSTTVRFYINGVEAGTRTPPNPITLDVGSYVYFGTGGRPSPFQTAMMIVYDRALSAGEVQQNFEATRGRFEI